MTVYIVTSGSYSDYQIQRGFSDRALAEKWIGDRDYDIEELILDDMSRLEANIKSEFRVTIGFDGIVRHAVPDFPYELIPESGRRFSLNAPSVFDWNVPTLDIHIPTTDRQTAIKTANEIRARMKAFNRTDPGWYMYHTLEKWEDKA